MKAQANAACPAPGSTPLALRGSRLCPSKIYGSGSSPTPALPIELDDWLAVARSAISAGGRGKIAQAGLLMRLNIDVGSAENLSGSMIYDHIGTISWNDSDGERISLSTGLALLHLNEFEDPSFVPPEDLTASSTNNTVIVYVPFPCFRGLEQAESTRKSTEYAWDLLSVLGGSFTINLNSHIGNPAASHGATVNFGAYQLVAETFDEQDQADGKGNVASFYGWRAMAKDYPITSNAPSIDLGGKNIIEMATAYVGVTGERTGAIFDVDATLTSPTSAFSFLKPVIGRFLIALAGQARRFCNIPTGIPAAWGNGTLLPLHAALPHLATDDPEVATAAFATSQQFGSGGFTSGNNPTLIVRQLAAKPAQKNAVSCNPDAVVIKSRNGDAIRAAALPEASREVSVRLPAYLASGRNAV